MTIFGYYIGIKIRKKQLLVTRVENSMVQQPKGMPLPLTLLFHILLLLVFIRAPPVGAASSADGGGNYDEQKGGRGGEHAKPAAAGDEQTKGKEKKEKQPHDEVSSPQLWLTAAATLRHNPREGDHDGLLLKAFFDGAKLGLPNEVTRAMVDQLCTKLDQLAAGARAKVLAVVETLAAADKSLSSGRDRASFCFRALFDVGASAAAG